MGIIAGNLRYNIEVHQLTTSKDSYGSENQVYSLKFKLRAGIKSNSGNYNINNNELFHFQTIIFLTYYRNIENTDIIIHDNKKYRILFINQIGYKEGLEITAELINE